MTSKFFLLVGILAILFGCSSNDEKIKIAGLTTGYVDSTAMVLYYPEHQSGSDTTFVIDNQFNFVVENAEADLFLIATVMDDNTNLEFMNFWVENNDITINAQKGNLRYANVQGSELQKLFDELSESTKNTQSRLDHLNDELDLTAEKDSTTYDSLLLLVSEAQSELLKKESSFVKEHPNSLVSANGLYFLMTNITKPETRSLFENLSPVMQESKYGKMVQKYLGNSQTFKVGDMVVDFQLPDLNGDSFGLSSYKNKHVLLEFWSSGCAPCRKENPNLLENYNEFKDKGFEILGVTLDTKKEAWEKAVLKDKIAWKTVGDLKGFRGDVPIKYSVPYIPKNYLLDPNGVILAQDLRGNKLREQLLEIF